MRHFGELKMRIVADPARCKLRFPRFGGTSCHVTFTFWEYLVRSIRQRYFHGHDLMAFTQAAQKLPTYYSSEYDSVYL